MSCRFFVFSLKTVVIVDKIMSDNYASDCNKSGSVEPYTLIMWGVGGPNSVDGENKEIKSPEKNDRDQGANSNQKIVLPLIEIYCVPAQITSILKAARVGCSLSLNLIMR